MSRTAWAVCVVLGLAIGFGAAWMTFAPKFAVQDVRQQVEDAIDEAARTSGDDPRQQIEAFVRELEAIDASGTPEDFQQLFAAYQELFRRGLSDYQRTGKMGRFDAEIERLARQISAY